MVLGEAMIVAGLGSRSAISAEQVDAAIDAALVHSHLPSDQLDLIAVPALKGAEAGIQAAAAGRGILLRLITQDLLEAANPRTVTRSKRSMAAMNVHSVAEAAALAGAGPNARLLAPRICVGPVTCALAKGEITA
jgi:cobalt-precorrin 5A hydrolase